MWQILVVAAVLGTGLLAKRFLIDGENKGLVADVKKKKKKKSKNGLSACRLSKREGRESKGLKKKGKRDFVWLKKRGCRRSIGKPGSSSSSGNSFFNWGLGVGVMYILSAGKDEMNKLNEAVDEATNVVDRLKSELHKRKLSRDLQDSSCKNRFTTSPMETMGKDKQQVISELSMEEDTKVLIPHLTDDVECASSVLTEEREHDLLEIEQLEAELESELQKLSRCTSEEPSGYEERTSNWVESFHTRAVASGSCFQLDPEHFMYPTTSVHSARGLLVPHKVVGSECNVFQFGGVPPSDLDREPCHLLIEQRECQTVELESKHSKETDFKVKVPELQQLKNSIYRIRKLSIQTPSDEEPEEATNDFEQELSGGVNFISLVDDSTKVSSSRQKALIGMKRPIEYGPCNCNSVHCE